MHYEWRLERICRYMARPAIATRRLERLADGRVRYRLRLIESPRSDNVLNVDYQPWILRRALDYTLEQLGEG